MVWDTGSFARHSQNREWLQKKGMIYTTEGQIPVKLGWFTKEGNDLQQWLQKKGMIYTTEGQIPVKLGWFTKEGNDLQH